MHPWFPKALPFLVALLLVFVAVLIRLDMEGVAWVFATMGSVLIIVSVLYWFLERRESDAP